MKFTLATSYRDVDLMEVPGLATIEVTPELRSIILDYQRLLAQVEAYKIVDFDCSVNWTQYEDDEEGNEIPGEVLRTELDQLHVSKTEFWYTCYAKHSDVELVTERVSIEDIL